MAHLLLLLELGVPCGTRALYSGKYFYNSNSCQFRHNAPAISENYM